jgi:hypothetical protein
VSPTLEGDVLIVLAGTTRPLTGREVARLARRGTPPAVAAALTRLVRPGLVHREEIGSAFLHTLNRDHLAAPAVLVLAGLRSELLERLSAAVADWEIQPVSAALFGSAARGDGDVEQEVTALLNSGPPVLESLRTEAISLAGIPPAQLLPEREPRRGRSRPAAPTPRSSSSASSVSRTSHSTALPS